MHQRQRIREAVVALLKAAATDAGERVAETRAIPWPRIQLPAIAVYSLDEEVDPDSAQSAPRELMRRLDLAIECAVQGANPDDAMDAIALQVERAMDADETFGGLASDSILSTTELQVLEQGDKLTGIARLVYSVTYYTPAGLPTDDLDDFKTADIQHGDLAHDILTGLDT